MDFDQVPNEWFCPITQELMKDPVIGSDGFTYENKAITQWLTKSTLSPVTRQPMEHKNLIPNLALRHTINQYLQKNSKQAIIRRDQGKVSEFKKREASKKVKHFQEEQVTLNYDSIQNGEQGLVNIEIVPPQQRTQAKRRPCSLICILDVSESMQTDAVLGGKDKESHGFSRLDLVKHSINTMIQFMNDSDQIALIPFNNSARVLMNPTKMTVAGKNLAKARVNELQAKGSTNIWDGLKISLDVAKTINFQNKNVFTVLLTDGQPNLNPPRGIVPTLRKFIEIQKLSSPNIHVFGYGYELDTKLLSQIAQVGNGTYAYIPDCSMVGTVFVNFMAAALSTVTNVAELSFENISRQMNLIEVVGWKMEKSQKINIGCIHYGQKRNIILKFKSKLSEIQFPVKILLKYGVSLKNQAQITLQRLGETKDKTKMEQIALRQQYLTMLINCIKNGKKIDHSLQNVHEFYYKVKQMHKEKETEFIDSLLKQLKNDSSENEGQVEKAFLKQQWYEKWGKHYIPSLFLAHLMETCTNFKDPALQNYGGKQFHEFQNTMDTIFIKMAPPQPSAKKEKDIVYKPAPVDMHHYYNNYGGCIDGKCLVRMFDGSQKKIKNLKKGDIVLSSQGNSTKVICMVRTNVFGFVQMSKIGDLLITPYHPIKINGSWVFPTQISKPQKLFVQSFFNYVLEGEQHLICEGVQCISLGHQINTNEVTKHEYLGSTLVTEDLKRSDQWRTGMVDVLEQIRDPQSMRVVSMKFKKTV